MEKVMKVHGGNKITIPSEVRKILHLKDGDLVLVDINNSKIVVTPLDLVPRP